MLAKSLVVLMIPTITVSLWAQSAAAPAPLSSGFVKTDFSGDWRALRIPVAFSPAAGAPQSPSIAAPPDSQDTRNWARRHLLLLTGLAVTGAGVAMVATGGDGTVSGCFATGGINGQPACATAQTWGGSGRHIGGILMLSLGVPLAAFGLFKHP